MRNTDKFCLFLGLFLAATLFRGANLCGATFETEPDDGLKGQWPQWRGPDGLGVSSEPNLPEIWNTKSQNIRWKVRIPGEGASSPVVSNGRVILTTAYESPKAAISQRFINVASLGLALVLFVGVAVKSFRNRREGTQKKIPPAKRGLAERFNRLFTGFTSFSFVCLALLVTIGRRHSDLVLGKFGLLLSKLGCEDMVHLCSVAEGVPAAVWLTSGGIALLGLAVSVGWLRAHSIWRLFGAGVVLFSAIPFVKFTPLDQWKEEIELWEKLVFIFPALVVAFWHLINYIEVGWKRGFELSKQRVSILRGRINVALRMLNYMEIRWRHKNIWHFGTVRSLLFVILLVAWSLLVFIPPNFFQSQRGLERAALCLDVKSGSTLWEQPVFVAPAERKHSENTYATPTAATDGKHIIVNFGLGIACLDFEGRILWRKRDLDYFENSRYGAVSSPLLTDDTVIVVQESEFGSKRPTWIAAFDKQSGRTRWKINAESMHNCYTTALLYQDGANTQLLTSSWENVTSYDVESGERLWMQEIPTQQLVASMARLGELLCVGGSTWGPKVITMMRLNSTEKGTNANILWQSKRGAPGNSSPVIYNGKLFVVTDTGIMTCYDAVSGTVLWDKRLRRGRYLLSLVAGDEKVYACNTKGVITVIAADSKLKVLAENDLQGRCYASPAIADGCILIRIANYLYCIEKERQ